MQPAVLTNQIYMYAKVLSIPRSVVQVVSRSTCGWKHEVGMLLASGHEGHEGLPVNGQIEFVCSHIKRYCLIVCVHMEMEVA